MNSSLQGRSSEEIKDLVRVLEEFTRSLAWMTGHESSLQDLGAISCPCGGDQETP